MCLWVSSFICYVKSRVCGEHNYQVLFCMQLSGLWLMWLPSFPWKQDSWGQHEAHLGPTGPRWAHVGPMNFAIWVTLYVAFKYVVYVTVKFCVFCSYRVRELCDCQFVCSYRVYVITNYGVICSCQIHCTCDCRILVLHVAIKYVLICKDLKVFL